MYQVKVQCRFSSILRAQSGWPCTSGRTAKLAWPVCMEVMRYPKGLSLMTHCMLVGLCCSNTLSLLSLLFKYTMPQQLTSACACEESRVRCITGSDCTRDSASITRMQLDNHQINTWTSCASPRNNPGLQGCQYCDHKLTPACLIVCRSKGRGWLG